MPEPVKRQLVLAFDAWAETDADTARELVRERTHFWCGVCSNHAEDVYHEIFGRHRHRRGDEEFIVPAEEEDGEV